MLLLSLELVLFWMLIKVSKLLNILIYTWSWYLQPTHVTGSDIYNFHVECFPSFGWPGCLKLFSRETTLWGASPPFPLIHASHCFLMSPWPPPSTFAYQSTFCSVINLSGKLSTFLPVVSSTASAFVKTLQKRPLSCRVCWRLIKLSWSVIRHPERGREREVGLVWGCLGWGVWGLAGSRPRTGSVGPYWLSQGEGLSLRTCRAGGW